jgi:hypothetical protein
MDNFQRILEEIDNMHLDKSKGYGRKGEPFYNIKAGADFLGIPWWQGCVMRMNDKMGRLSAAAHGSDLGEEGVEDALIDLATYAVIALALWREEQEKNLTWAKAQHPAFQYWISQAKEREED